LRDTNSRTVRWIFRPTVGRKVCAETGSWSWGEQAAETSLSLAGRTCYERTDRQAATAGVPTRDRHRGGNGTARTPSATFRHLLQQHIPCQLPPRGPEKRANLFFPKKIPISPCSDDHQPPRRWWGNSYTLSRVCGAIRSSARVQVVRFAPARLPTRGVPNWPLRRPVAGLPAPTEDGGWRSRQPRWNKP